MGSSLIRSITYVSTIPKSKPLGKKFRQGVLGKLKTLTWPKYLLSPMEWLGATWFLAPWRSKRRFVECPRGGGGGRSSRIRPGSYDKVKSRGAEGKENYQCSSSLITEKTGCRGCNNQRAKRNNWTSSYNSNELSGIWSRERRRRMCVCAINIYCGQQCPVVWNLSKVRQSNIQPCAVPHNSAHGTINLTSTPDYRWILLNLAGPTCNLNGSQGRFTDNARIKICNLSKQIPRKFLAFLERGGQWIQLRLEAKLTNRDENHPRLIWIERRVNTGGAPSIPGERGWKEVARKGHQEKTRCQTSALILGYIYSAA